MDISKYAYGTTDTISDNEYWGTSILEYLTNQPIKERKPNMETLYQVIVVSKDREILLKDYVVAEGEDEAKFYVDIHSVLRQKKLKLKDVTILANELGDVKVRKEAQKVKVVDKDEE